MTKYNQTEATAKRQLFPRKQWISVNVVQCGRVVANFSSPGLAQHHITANALKGAYKEFVR